MTRWQYRVTIKGEIGALAGELFEGVPVMTEDGNTVVIVRDQAELFGLVQRISDLGLTMLSAAQAEQPARPAP